MSLSLFPAFYDCPARIRVAHQEKDEHVELFLRQHWVTNAPWILVVILVSLLPLASPGLKGLVESFVLIQIPFEVVTSLIVLWYLLVFAYAIEKFLHWYFNIYIVTNKHLIDIDLFNLLYRNVTEARLDDVQSARSKIQGIMGSLFNFGDVVIETAAEKQNIEFLSVPRPDFVADRVQDLQDLQEGINNAN